MGFSVVCLSRSLAAGGEDIGRVVAERLGFRYVDEEIIFKAARLAQVEPGVVAATEHKQPLLARLLDKLGAAQDLAGPVTLAAGLPIEFFQVPDAPRSAPDDLRAMIRAAIHEVADAGQAVIVAHAASMALGGSSRVLRVLVTASENVRAERLAETQKLTREDAARAIAKSDKERAHYFNEFYRVRQELPTHYDLVVNTDTITPEQAVSLIEFTARL